MCRNWISSALRFRKKYAHFAFFGQKPWKMIIIPPEHDNHTSTRGVIGQCLILDCCLFPYFFYLKVFHWFRFRYLISYQCNMYIPRPYLFISTGRLQCCPIQKPYSLRESALVGDQNGIPVVDIKKVEPDQTKLKSV